MAYAQDLLSYDMNLVPTHSGPYFLYVVCSVLFHFVKFHYTYRIWGNDNIVDVMEPVSNGKFIGFCFMVSLIFLFRSSDSLDFQLNGIKKDVRIKQTPQWTGHECEIP